jgi:hypothetical protein
MSPALRYCHKCLPMSGRCSTFILTQAACFVQALHSDPEKWEAMLSHAGSPAHIMAMKDSVNGDATCTNWDLGEAAGHFLPYHVVDFWMNLALCHALLVDKANGLAVYQVCD